MAEGAAVPPPLAYLDFCRRQPLDCGIDAADVARALAARPAGDHWAGRFAAARSAETAPGATWGSAGRRSVPARFAAPPAPQAAAPEGAVTFTAELWSRAARVNTAVNRDVVRRSDRATYGVEDRWATPLAAGIRAGDCEDYVLEKRRALVEAGVAPQALNIALVTTPRGEAHAVLLLATDRGEYVLDNLTPWIVPWDQAPYRWRIRQQAGRALDWAAVGDPAPRIAAAY